ncbi:hypothetical protein SFC81_04400 [Enterococcus faecalis]
MLTLLIIILVSIVFSFIYRNIFIDKNNVVWDIVLCILFFFLLAYILTDLEIFNNQFVNNYGRTVKNMLEILLLFLAVLAIFYTLIGFFGKRYTLRVDNFNIGGINVFFDKSNEIFIKTVGTFIASKRSIFYFKKERDNIYEVLNSYYSVYDFIRSNIELLDSEKDKELYEISVDILKKLNNFLTKHQNDYRRWYDKIISDDKILTYRKEIVVHRTTIEEVQKEYYRYEEILKDIYEINEYMSSDIVKNSFQINFFDWSDE